MDGPTPAAGPVANINATPEVVQATAIVEENQDFSQTPDTPVVDGPATKTPMRQRILQRLSRSSSFASISGSSSGRARSNSSPYRSSAGPSCISLSPSIAPHVSSSLGSNALPSDLGTTTAPASSSPSSRPDSPSTTPFPPFPHSVDRCKSSNAIRKVDLTSMGVAEPSTSALPADMVRAASMPLLRQRTRLPRTFAQSWKLLPLEVKIRVLSFLSHKDLVRASRINRDMYGACFDGQLWTTLDAVEFYNKIPVTSLEQILNKAGPFIKRLNLRGCVQVRDMDALALINSRCTNIVSVTLEGSQIDTEQLDALFRTNKDLIKMDLRGLDTVINSNCLTIASYCHKLEVLDLSWCKNIDALAVGVILESCRKLRDLRVSEIRNFGRLDTAKKFFKKGRLERLDLSACRDLTNQALVVMMHGVDPPRDVFSNKPLTKPRVLRHLNISRCPLITDYALEAVGHCAPHLETLVLSGLRHITDDGLRPVLDSATNLTTLELDDLSQLTDEILIDGIATAPCATKSLKHLSLSSCESISDDGLVPVLRACSNLETLRLDNTAVTNLTLVEASNAVRQRPPTPCSHNSGVFRRTPYIGLLMDIFDCQNITWSGVREIMSQNSSAVQPAFLARNEASTQVISLKCYYRWQPTVDEHTLRILRGKVDLANRLEQTWVNYMQASDEADLRGAGQRRRQRRMRQAELRHAGDLAGQAELGHDEVELEPASRQRARTATCLVM